MSAKAFKLLLKEKEKSLEEITVSDNEDDIIGSWKNNDNLFKMLNIEQEDNDVDLCTSHVQHKKSKKKKSKNKPKDSKPIDDNLDDNLLIEKYINENNSIVSVPINVNLQTKNHFHLQVEYRFLKPENELKRLFGNLAIKKDKRKSNVSAKLIVPKTEWVSFLKAGLSMRVLEKNDFSTKFVFEHSKSYREIQFKFLDAVESFVPQEIMNLHKEHPSHIDTMLQVCDMCCTHENWEMATELIERSLYIFESAFHPLFSCTQQNIELPYKYKENRSFFVTLFRHMTFLGRRGCCRTALEFSKLILNLDLSDPLAILLVIDFYALRCEEYELLICMWKEWKEQKNLHLLPNLAFSVALATFKTSNLNNATLEDADKMLQDALLTFPSFLPLLLEKCSIKADEEVSKHKFITIQPNTDCDGLKMLIRLYVHRSHACWKDTSVVGWLERNVKQALKRVEANEPFVADMQKKNAIRFKAPPLNVYRHIILSGIKEATVTLSPELTMTTILSFDPLPPNDSISSYERPKRQASNSQSDSWLSLFFESILPSFNAQRLGEERNGEGGQQQRRNFMEIIREMQANIQFDPPPQEGGNPPLDENGDWD